MPKKQLTIDPKTGKLSRIKDTELPLVQLANSLNEGDPVAPFGSLTTDIIEVCLYDTDDNYLSSATIRIPLPESLDIGQYVRSMGYERGTYKIVFNFLREIGGSSIPKFVKKDKTIWDGEFTLDTDGKLYAGSVSKPVIDPDTQEKIELTAENDKFWLQEISPSRTEIRLRPNPAINDADANERFRLLGYTCLCQADVNGEAPLTFDDTGKSATVNWVLNGGQEVSLNELMKGGTLIIRDAFVIDYEESPETISTYTPVVETITAAASDNLATNGHFNSGNGVVQETDSNPKNEVVEFPNPGHSKWCLLTSPAGGEGGTKDVEYQMDFEVIPGETYVLSCWIYHDEDWNGRTDAHFYSRAFTDNVNGITISGVGTVLETKVVDGKTWERQYSRIIIPPEGTGKLSWYLGAGAEKPGTPVLSGNRYYTDIQCEPGSSTSLPTSYMMEERPEELEIPSTGLIKFIDDNTVSATLNGDEEGLVELMQSGDNRESGVLTIKNAIVTDETFDVKTDRTIVDGIPTDNSDASIIREKGSETEFNKSPFHGDGQTDSTDLNITLQANDTYRLIKVNSNGNEEEVGRYDLPVDVTVVDEIPVEPSMAPEIVIEEKKLHKSSFHGDNQSDSNELIVTIHSNDIYRLYRIDSDGIEELIGEYGIPEEVKEIDDLELINPDGSEIRENKNEGEWGATASPYHSTTDNKIILQVDTKYTLYRLRPNGEEIQIGTHDNWKESKEWSLDSLVDGDKLRILTENTGGKNGFIGKIYYNNQIYKTGDPKSKYQSDDDQEISITTDGIWDARAFTLRRRAKWWKFGFGDDIYDWFDTTAIFGSNIFLPTKTYGIPEKVKQWKGKVHKDLEDCKVIWTGPNYRELRWEWEPSVNVHERIWKRQDPALNVRSVHPVAWSSGLSVHSWSSSGAYAFWKTGWLGHQAKWVNGEGHGGGPAMKFIDQNSQFQNPNHPDYNGKYFDIDGNRVPDHTINYAYGNRWGYGSADHPISLEHRGQWIDQRPPFSFESQGIKIGDKLKISWWQKSDTVGKGARVYIRYWKKEAPIDGVFWDSATTTVGNTLRFIPVSKEGEWEKAEYTFEVQEDFDLSRMGSSIYGDRNIGPLFRIDGYFGPEGILWVSEPKITLVSDVDNPEVTNTITLDDFEPTDKLKLYTTNLGTEPRGFLSKVTYKGKEYRTGDQDKEHYYDDFAGSTLTVDLPGTWQITDAENKNWTDLGEVTDDKIDPELKDSKWIWSSEDTNEVVWQWLPNNNIVDGIWNYPNPVTYEDAVGITGWSDGFNPFHWGGDSSKQSELFWHSGWVGHHAKWVRDEGQFGTCIKFVDMNSQFVSPNHQDYDGLNGTGNNSGAQATLEHRDMFVYADLPNKLASQGIQEGSFIKISWWQKTNVQGKGAQVGLRHFNKDGQISWGPDNEFRRMIPCTSVDEWEQVNYTGVVDEDWDLTKTDKIYVKGHFGPEGMLWVENVTIEIISGIATDPDQTNIYTVHNFNSDDKLKLYTTNLGTLPNGFISKISYRGTEYKTGDPGVDFYTDPITDETITINLPGVWKIPGSNWKTLGKSEEVNPDLVVDPTLSNAVWVGNTDEVEGQQLWEWNPLGDIGNYIWNYPNPTLRTDAVWPENWSNGFQNFNFNDEGQRFWHSGWVGHHAKFVPEEGRDGETAMKFIDQNSGFDSPNHQYYVGDYKTGNSSDADQTLKHREMMLSQKLPHTMAAQGVEVGDQLTISWRQKSDTVGKGARVGIRHYNTTVSDVDPLENTLTGTLQMRSNDDTIYQLVSYNNSELIGKAFPNMTVAVSNPSRGISGTLTLQEINLSTSVLTFTSGIQGFQRGDTLDFTLDTSQHDVPVGPFGVETTNAYSNIENTQKDREWLRYIPTTTGDWQDVSYSVIVDGDFDLTQPSWLVVYGHKGPEGMLWVENVEIKITVDNQQISVVPVFGDFVAEIDGWIDRNTLTVKGGYNSVAESLGHISDNSDNIRSYSTFDEFSVEYTSSVYSAEPILGSLRGEIANVNDDTITLVNSFNEIATEAGHDLENYPLEALQSDDGLLAFNKWFIQYPTDSTENLGKLLKLGPNKYDVITNFKIDTQTYPEYPHSLVYKLYEPLPDDIVNHDFVTVVREMIPPIEETCTLIPFVDEWVSDVVLRTPEFQSVTSPIGTGQTEFKNYTELATSNSDIKNKLEDEVISGSLSADINVDFNLFENFIHFSSAEQRVKNFKYKLDLIEQYTDRSASLAGAGSGSTGTIGVVAAPGSGSYITISGSQSLNPPFTPVSGSLTQIQSWETKRRLMINSFDKFEKYMFNQSSSYSSQSIGLFHDNAWPKRGGSGSYAYPYILTRTSQSISTTWYDNQIISASAYDRANKNRLKTHLPTFVQDDSQNDVFLTFVDMIGHHFDDIWVFIKSMTDVYDRRDKLSEGVAKDLLKPVAQSFGWEVQDGKDLISMQRYILGMESTGSEEPWVYSGTSDRDISREIWSRIINNMPYFLKTKGTARAIKGLISCYGIPSTILRVMEYGGPKLSGQTPEFLTTRKFTKSLNFFGASNNTYVNTNTWLPVVSGSGSTSRLPDTVEFRFKAATGSNQVLVRRGDDWAIRLLDNGSIDNYGRVSFVLSGSEGYIETSSSAFPVFDGEFYSVMLTRASASGKFLSDDTPSQDVVYSLYTKKYDAGRSKIFLESTATLAVSGSAGATSESYNASWTGSGGQITIGGPQENTYFGESFSGSMMEFRLWTTPLTESAFDNHVASPMAFDGNTPSASYMDMVTRYSFDDDKDLSVAANQWFQDASADQSFTSSATPTNYAGGTSDYHFSAVVDETKMKIPNLGPSMKSSNKLRIENDTLLDLAQSANPILKFKESITIPAYDNAPVDSNKLGIFFSPTAVIDEDIISSLPNIDFDQYIGDPRDQYKEQYTGLTTARNLYWQKYSGPNNFWDYLRLLKYYDSSLYRQIRDLIPARANATVGILIEPTILERDKVIIGKKPTFETAHFKSDIDLYYISESARYTPLDSEINWSNEFGIGPYQATGSYISASSYYMPLDSEINWSNEFGISPYQATGSYISASSEYTPLDSDINYSNPFKVNFHTKETGSYISASADYVPLDSSLNYSNPFKVNYLTQETSSFISASSDYVPLESNMQYADTYRVNSHTQESGSFISASALYDDINMISNINLRNPYLLDGRTQITGSGVSMSADFSSLSAPSETLGENARGTGSFVLKHILERPSLYGIGDRDTSGWYGNDYYNSTIQEGSQKLIFEEVVMPRVETNVTSEFNREIQYYYSSSLSSSLGIYYSSSFVTTDLDNRWDDTLGTERLFYLGCSQTDTTTVSDKGGRYRDKTPAVDVTVTSPTRLVTTDSPSTPLDVAR